MALLYAVPVTVLIMDHPHVIVRVSQVHIVLRRLESLSKPALRRTAHSLLPLLTVLESLRTTIGPSDAITVESASSAYVENFAIRVFSSADNEDRRNAATRVTAKKFLGFSYFL